MKTRNRHGPYYRVKRYLEFALHGKWSQINVSSDAHHLIVAGAVLRLDDLSRESRTALAFTLLCQRLSRRQRKLSRLRPAIYGTTPACRLDVMEFHRLRGKAIPALLRNVRRLAEGLTDSVLRTEFSEAFITE